MAINALIVQMNAEGIPATLELPGGTWCHSPEYVQRRYGGKVKKAKPVQVEKPLDPKLQKLMDRLDATKLTPSERAMLIAFLEDK